MTAATQWEYAEYTVSASSSDVTVRFYWSQGDGFVARAKGWFGELLMEGGSATNLLRLNGQVAAPAVLAFLGTNGWEMSGFALAASGDARYLFKRPFGNTDIGKPV
jgi:hypothetical protein